eukprot:TRINITY_DN1079_c1_g1_i1.p1 TRINITY_DN1079_c1_g1~~TRINITY_DN1079_c1_g1_i1.p1  ORF type:complete len:399 (-),score=39.42 TRINITY_DN1079_c1_g1_i1:27-1223(-)
MNLPTVKGLLSFQPATGLCNTTVLKFQAYPTVHPNDTPLGWYTELFGRRTPTTRTQSWTSSALSSVMSFNPQAQYFVLGYQAIEGPLAAILTRYLTQHIYVPYVLRKAPLANKKMLAIEGHRLSLWRGVTIGYFLCHTVVLMGVGMLSHPFSLVRTHFLVTGHLPLEGFWANLKHTWEGGNQSLYARTIFGHFLTSVPDLWVYGIVLRGCLSVSDRLIEYYKVNDDIERYKPIPMKASAPVYPYYHQQPQQQHTTTTATLPQPAAEVRAYRWAQVKRVFLETASRITAQFATRTLLFPLFTIRARLEAQYCSYADHAVAAIATKAVLPEFRGLAHCAQHLYQTEGVRGFYRGIATHLTGFAAQGVYMAIITALAYGCVQHDLWEDEVQTHSRPSYPVS